MAQGACPSPLPPVQQGRSNSPALLPGRLRRQRHRLPPRLAAEAARHQGQRAGHGPAALCGHGEHRWGRLTLLGMRPDLWGRGAHSGQSDGSVPGAGISLTGVLSARWSLCTPSPLSLALGAAPGVAAVGRGWPWSPARHPHGSICHPRVPSRGNGWHVGAWLHPGLRPPARAGSVAQPSRAARGALCAASLPTGHPRP